MKEKLLLLKEKEIVKNIIKFPCDTRTSMQAANAIGCTVGEIAKTILFKIKNFDDVLIVVIASGSNKINEKKIEDMCGESIEKPSAEYIKKHTGYVIGGVCPIDLSAKFVYFDKDLLDYKYIWASSGDVDSVFSITPKELVILTNAKVVEIK